MQAAMLRESCFAAQHFLLLSANDARHDLGVVSALPQGSWSIET